MKYFENIKIVKYTLKGNSSHFKQKLLKGFPSKSRYSSMTIIFEYSSDHTCLELQNLICHTISYKIHKNFESLIPISFTF